MSNIPDVSVLITQAAEEAKLKKHISPQKLRNLLAVVPQVEIPDDLRKKLLDGVELTRRNSRGIINALADWLKAEVNVKIPEDRHNFDTCNSHLSNCYQCAAEEDTIRKAIATIATQQSPKSRRTDIMAEAVSFAVINKLGAAPYGKLITTATLQNHYFETMKARYKVAKAVAGGAPLNSFKI